MCDHVGIHARIALPGSLIFLFVIDILRAGHTTQSLLFYGGYIMCALLQVTQGCVCLTAGQSEGVCLTAGQSGGVCLTAGQSGWVCLTAGQSGGVCLTAGHSGGVCLTAGHSGMCAYCRSVRGCVP